MKAIQDYYNDEFSQCYGCGRLNEKGLQIKTYWDGDGDETLTKYTPKPYHSAIPGIAYGGMLASIIDCHGTGSASLALARENNIELIDGNAPRCVTASLKIDYKRPTPLNGPLEIRGKISEIKGKRVVVDASLYADGKLTVKGQIVAVWIGEDFIK